MALRPTSRGSRCVPPKRGIRPRPSWANREARRPRGDANVSGHRQFHPFVGGVAVDDRERRLGEHRERFDQLGRSIHVVVEAGAEVFARAA